MPSIINRIGVVGDFDEETGGDGADPGETATTPGDTTPIEVKSEAPEPAAAPAPSPAATKPKRKR